MSIEKSDLISDRIIAIADAEGINIKELADKIGVPYTTLHNYVSGRSVPKWDFFVVLFDYGINLHWFVTGKDEMFRDTSKSKLVSFDDHDHDHDKGVIRLIESWWGQATLDEQTWLKISIEKLLKK